MSPEEIQEIQELANGGLSIRAIARKLARNVKTIRRVLGRPRQGRSESKLDRFKEKILELDGEELRLPRILREIRELEGKAGGKTGKESGK